jgi:CheY-like chemotaxis protein
VLNPIRGVPDGEQAIAYLNRDEPYNDCEKYPLPILFLLDLNMPRKSGFDVLSWLQACPKTNLGVVVLTGIAGLKEVDRAYALGAHSFLVKPLVIQDFLNLANAIKGIQIEQGAILKCLGRRIR